MTCLSGIFVSRGFAALKTRFLPRGFLVWRQTKCLPADFLLGRTFFCQWLDKRIGVVAALAQPVVVLWDGHRWLAGRGESFKP